METLLRDAPGKRGPEADSPFHNPGSRIRRTYQVTIKHQT